LNFRPYRQHDTAIGSLTMVSTDSIDLDQFSNWLKSYLQKHSNNIFRVKGVLSIKGKDNRFVLQGVHDHFSIQEHLPWGKEKPFCKVVFIGKDINPTDIKASCNENVSTNFNVERLGEAPPPSPIKLVFLLIMIIAILYGDKINEMVSYQTLIGVGLIIFALYTLFIRQKSNVKQ